MWTGDRIENKEASARAVLTLLLGIAEKQSARVAATARGVGSAEMAVDPASAPASAPTSVAGR